MPRLQLLPEMSDAAREAVRQTTNQGGWMMVLLSSVDDHTGSTEAQVPFKHLRILMGGVANALRIAAHSPKVARPLAGFLIAAPRKEVSGVLDVRHMVNNIKESRVSNPEDHIAFMDLCGAGSAA